MQEILIETPSVFDAAIPFAIARAAYLFPHCAFERRDDAIVVSGPATENEADLKKEIFYLLYREHIRNKFEPFRQRALGRLYGRDT